MFRNIFASLNDEVHNKRWLVGIILLAVLLRVASALYLGDEVVNLPGIYDQISYDRLAKNLVAGNGFSFDVDWWPATRTGEPTAHWSYLMTFFLAFIYKLFGHHPLIARLIQAFITGILTPWFAYRISRRVFRKTATQSSSSLNAVSILAAAWVGLYGYFIYYGAALMTESFFILAILWSLDSALRIAQYQKDRIEASSPSVVPGPNLWRLLELGLAFSLAVLLRQAYLLFLPFLLSWLWWAGFRLPKAKALKVPTSNLRRIPLDFLSGSVVALFVLSLFILPFTLYNYQRFDRFVLLNTNSGYAFFWANHPIHGYKFVPLFTEEMPTYVELIPQELLHLDEAALDQALMKLGMGFVFKNPWRYFVLTLSRIPEHFIFWPLPSSHPISNLTRVGSLGLALPFSLLGFGFWFAEIRRNQFAEPSAGALLLFFFIIYNGIYLGSWAGIRYRLPVDPILVMFGAYALYRVFLKFNNSSEKF